MDANSNSDHPAWVKVPSCYCHALCMWERACTCKCAQHHQVLGCMLYVLSMPLPTCRQHADRLLSERVVRQATGQHVRSVSEWELHACFAYLVGRGRSVACWMAGTLAVVAGGLCRTDDGGQGATAGGSMVWSKPLINSQSLPCQSLCSCASKASHAPAERCIKSKQTPCVLAVSRPEPHARASHRIPAGHTCPYVACLITCMLHCHIHICMLLTRALAALSPAASALSPASARSRVESEAAEAERGLREALDRMDCVWLAGGRPFMTGRQQAAGAAILHERTGITRQRVTWLTCHLASSCGT